MFAGFPALMTADVVPTVAAAGGLSAQILATQAASLKAYWKCDETAGATTLADSSGNTNTLTLSGVAATDYNLNQTGSGGTTGASIQWLGLAGRATIASNVIGANLVAQDFTFFMLVKYTATPDATPIVIGQSGNFRGAGITHSHGRSDNLCGWISDSNDAFITDIVANDDNWHDMTFTRNGATYSVYLDGAFVNSDTPTIVFDIICDETLLGGRNDAFGLREPFNGYQQHAAIWSVALSGAEITAIHGAR